MENSQKFDKEIGRAMLVSFILVIIVVFLFMVFGYSLSNLVLAMKEYGI